MNVSQLYMIKQNQFNEIREKHKLRNRTQKWKEQAEWKVNTNDWR
jgi:hypothetical protein